MIAPRPPDYDAVHWGAGPGLLVCIKCGALVFPDPDATEDKHVLWHTTNDRLDGPPEPTT